MGVAVWAVIGGVLLLAEFAMPELVVIFFGLGALLNALLIALIPALREQVPLQILLWALTSGLALAFLRKYAARWFRGRDLGPEADSREDSGKMAEVIEEITPTSPGRIRFRGTTWQAVAVEETLPVGTRVTVLEKQSLSYLVTEGDIVDEH